MTWADVFAVLCRRYGWSWDQVADMSLDQVRLALDALADADAQASGKRRRRRKPGTIPIRSDEDLWRALGRS